MQEPDRNQYYQTPAVRSPHGELTYGQPRYEEDPIGSDFAGSQGGAGILEVNELVAAANPLITLITQLKHTVEQHNVPNLRAQIVEEMKLLDRRLRAIDYPKPIEEKIIVAARYCLCTAIDEAVLSRPWGVQSDWTQQTLLNMIHRETSGGERFYVILENMMQDPIRNIDFIEFAYVLLSLGFEGKLHGVENRAFREELRSRVFYRIRMTRPKSDRVLSSHWRLAKIPTTDKTKITKLKRTGVTTLVILVIFGFYFNYQVNSAASPTLGKLNGIATAPPITTFADVIPRQIVVRNSVDN